MTQSTGAVECTDYISAEGLTPTPNECPGFDTKQLNDGALRMCKKVKLATTVEDNPKARFSIAEM